MFPLSFMVGDKGNITQGKTILFLAFQLHKRRDDFLIIVTLF